MHESSSSLDLVGFGNNKFKYKLFGISGYTLLLLPKCMKLKDKRHEEHNDLGYFWPFISKSWFEYCLTNTSLAFVTKDTWKFDFVTTGAAHLSWIFFMTTFKENFSFSYFNSWILKELNISVCYEWKYISQLSIKYLLTGWNQFQVLFRNVNTRFLIAIWGFTAFSLNLLFYTTKTIISNHCLSNIIEISKNTINILQNIMK